MNMEYPSGECKCCDKLADENAALKEQLDHAFAHKQQQETIAQQAAVIEQMHEAVQIKDATLTMLLPALITSMYKEEASYGKLWVYQQRRLRRFLT